jgi:hypothetical protein
MNVEMRGTTEAANHLTLLTGQSSIVRLVSNATQGGSLTRNLYRLRYARIKSKNAYP